MTWVRAPGVLLALQGFYLLFMIVVTSQVRSNFQPCAQQHRSACLLLVIGVLLLVLFIHVSH